MNKGIELLDEILVAINNNPNEDVEALIKGVLSQHGATEESLTNIEYSFSYIDMLGNKLTELKAAQEQGHSRVEWLNEEIENQMKKIPPLTNDRKDKIIDTLKKGIENILNCQIMDKKYGE